jgi:predicted DNA-binding transcriptional regulator YafY
MDAILTSCVIEVRYVRWREPREIKRRLRPYGLVLKSGAWYLVAGTGGGRVATYRVAQLREVAVSGEPFERPADFGLAAHWSAYLAEFEARRFTGEATIRISPRGRKRLVDLADAAVGGAVERSAGGPGPGGWVEAVIPIESVRHACQELLRLGDDVEVLAPAQLREAFVATVRALAARYLAES